MNEVDLLTRNGEHVTRVQVPDWKVPAEVIAWGERFFVRDPAGQYREGLVHFVAAASTEASGDASA